MSSDTYHVDRYSPLGKAWPKGSWDDEPDRLEWRHLGFPCLIVRSSLSGALCGYVGLPLEHPWLGVEQSDIQVHGGITFSERCKPGSAICHTPLPGEPRDVHWIGFDCAHARDVSPALLASFPDWSVIIKNAVYRDLPYVRTEVERLAEQAKQAANQ